MLIYKDFLYFTMKNELREDKQLIQVVVLKALVKKLKEAARQDHRTLSAFCALLLEKGMENYPFSPLCSTAEATAPGGNQNGKQD